MKTLRNKIKVTFLLLVLVMSFIGCSNDNDKIVNSDIKSNENVEITINKNVEVENNDMLAFEYSTSESSVTKDKDDLSYSINFPQIEVSNDSEKQERINSIIENEALKVLNYYKSSFGNVELEIFYKITLKSSRILSIQYYGSGVVSGAAHPNKLFYTSNIDLLNESLIRLSDVVNVIEDFCQKFIEGEFRALWLEQSERVDLKALELEKLLLDFKNVDSFDNIETEEQSDVFCYLTENSLGISIPVAYAIGGHAEYEIEYQKIVDNKAGNDLLDVLFNVNNK